MARNGYYVQVQVSTCNNEHGTGPCVKLCHRWQERERERGTPRPPVDERGAAWSEQNNFQKQKNL